MRRKNPVVHYKDADDAYKRLSARLFAYASSLLINKDQKIDAVHNAFIKVIKWVKDHPDRHISHIIVFRLVLREVHKMNRHNHSVSLDDPLMAPYFRSRQL